MTSLLGAAALVACADPTSEDAAPPPPGDSWRAVSVGDGLDESGRPVTTAGAAFYLDEGGTLYRSDAPAVPLPVHITSIPASRDGTGEAPEEKHAEIIFDEDNRTPYTSDATLTGFNKRTIGRLTWSDANTISGGQCTGSLVGPRHVLTSAHCVLDQFGNFIPVANFRFTPGSRGPGYGVTTPNGTKRAVGVYARSSSDTWDYALIILRDDEGTHALDWMGMTWRSDDDWYEGRTMSLVGYPGADQTCWTSPASTFPECGGFMYGQQCPIDWADEDLEYECDQTAGQSGSPVYTWINSQPVVIGVARGSTSTPVNSWNKAVRLNHTKMGDLCSWIGNHPSAHRTRTCTP